MKRYFIGLTVILLAFAVLFALPASAAESEPPSFETAEEAVSYIRTQLKERTADFSFFYTGEEALCTEDVLRYENSAPDEGDYLRWNIQSYTEIFDPDGSRRFSVKYLSTKKLENSVADAAAEIVAAQPDTVASGPAGEYQRALYAYRRLCDSGSILPSNSYGLWDYNAHSALVKKNAKCQGYALAYYRLARELGLDCRILVGQLEGSAASEAASLSHAWNAIRIGESWYMADAWLGVAAAQCGEDPLDYFMIPSSWEHLRYTPVFDSPESDESLAFLSLKTPSEIGSYPFADELSGVCGDAAWTLRLSDGVVTVCAPPPSAAGDLHWSVFREKARAVILAANANTYCGSCMRGSGLILHAASGAEPLAAAGNEGIACHTLSELPAVDATCKTAGVEAGLGCADCGVFAYGGEPIPVRDAHPDNGDGFCAVCGIALDCIAHGFCGMDVQWYLTQDHELMLTGIGSMMDFPNESFAPWAVYSDWIRRITVKSGVTYVGDYAFANCGSNTEVCLSEGLLRIGKYSFYKEKALTSVSLPSSLIEIGANAFGRCEQLREVILPSGLQMLGAGAFCYTDVRSIVIPASLQTEGAVGNVFYASVLETILFEDGVQRIPDGFCKMAQKLQTVVLPATVVEIGENAFYQCTSLQSINLPDGLRSIGDYAFSRCISLTEITLPTTLRELGAMAFQSCRNLTRMEIPEGITRIEGLFHSCASLRTVSLPDSLTEIGSKSFQNCSALSSLRLPKNIKTINGLSFSASGLTFIAIPESVTKIGYKAFADCASLTDVCILGTDIKEVDPTVFVDCTESLVIHCGETVASGILFDPEQPFPGRIHTALTDEPPASFCSETDPAAFLFRCQDCEKTFMEDGILDHGGHTVAVVSPIAPTCFMPGRTEGAYCTACGEVLMESQEIPANGHTPVIRPAVPPTCTEWGH